MAEIEGKNQLEICENNVETIEKNPVTDDCTESNSKSLNKEEYFEELRDWVSESNRAQQAHNNFVIWMIQMGLMMETQQQAEQHQMQRNTFRSPNMLRLSYEAIRTNHPPINNSPSILLSRLFNYLRNYFYNNRRYERIITYSGGFEFIISPLWKRLVAEIIDIVILLIIFGSVVTMIKKFFKLEMIFDMDYINQFLNDDDENYGIVLYGLIILDFVFKPVVSFYEALWTMDGGGVIGGATPGKLIMGIRIICTDTIVRQRIQIENRNWFTRPIRVLVLPVKSLGFRRAYFRAFCKNVLLLLLFPMSLLSFGFSNNRNSYDFIVKTIVVENQYQGRGVRRRLDE